MLAQHILVPTDFSAYADQALYDVMGLAKALQARLTCLHVMHLTPIQRCLNRLDMNRDVFHRVLFLEEGLDGVCNIMGRNRGELRVNGDHNIHTR